MIIKKIQIKNFRSYYGDNHLSLSKSLTLVIGDNGDGKTTLFEALEWLFDTTGENRKESHISEKRKSELRIGESDEVAVNISFEHDGEKEIEKCFTFEKTTTDNIRTKDYKFIGYVVDGSERRRVAGDILLNMCFEPVIRKYCLFKGENELNVFDNDTALKTLVDTFSGIRDFDKLVDLTSSFEQSSARATSRELQNDRKVSKQAKELNAQLTDVVNDIQSIKTELNQKKISINKFSSELENLEKNQETTERYQAIKERIKGLKDKRVRLLALSSCEYNTNLLDEYWILRSFPPIIKEFSAKVSALSKEKRRLDKQETERRAKKAGEREAISRIQKLANDAVPLPWNLPDEATMKEMIDDEICKVCGRPAPKDSDAYKFMCNKLNEYLAHIAEEANINSNTKEDDEKPLFVNSFINELHSRQIRLSGDNEQEISKIATTITDCLEFVNTRKEELAEVEKQLKELEQEQSDLLVQSGSTAELLDKNILDLRGFFDTKSRYESRVSELETTLKFKESLKAEIQEKLSQLTPGSSMTQVYQRVHTAFERITKAFANAKEQNINNFLQMLEAESNKYLKKLNKNDFYGIIRIRKTINNSARIELYSDNNTRIENPNGALKTTMYMSVLFAISQITTLKREQDYPLIFDAPTSSFGNYKRDIFYNVIDQIDKQCVIATKDLLILDNETGEKKLDMETINKLNCSVYRIKKVEPFDENKIETIQTTIEIVKNSLL
ncbi:MAG: AAA family ATPase [Bacteroidales bacterium]|nr:AAA family ATPase [Bacteroidales bacterium]